MASYSLLVSWYIHLPSLAAQHFESKYPNNPHSHIRVIIIISCIALLTAIHLTPGIPTLYNLFDTARLISSSCSHCVHLLNQP
jgi:hypothetical protein